MSKLSRMQLNAIMTAAALVSYPPAATFASLLGGNVEASSDFSRTRLFNNAVFDSRGFGIQGSNQGVLSSATAGGTGVDLTLSAVSGSGVTATFSAVSISLVGTNAADVGRVILLDASGVYATVTAAINTTSCTVTITGTASTTNWPRGTYSMVPSFDASGWPAMAVQLIITAPAAGTTADGNLVAGTYYYNYKSVSQSTTMTLSASSGTTINSTTLLGDGVTTQVKFTVTTGAQASFNFSGPCTDHDCARDGSLNSQGQSEFTSAALSHHAIYSSLRFMDFLSTNARAETRWAARSPGTKMWQKRWGGQYSWELCARFANAIAAYPGSKLTQILLNLPGYCDTAYATQCATLLSTVLNPALKVIVSKANEPWNPTFSFWTNYGISAAIEAKVVSDASTNGQRSNGTITSIAGDGTTATVTMDALPSFITPGAPFVMYCRADATYNAGTIATPITVQSVSGNAFTYLSSKTTFTLANTFSAYFNLASNLVNDGTTLNHTELTHKYYVREEYNASVAWTAVRPQDKWGLNISLWGSGNNGAGIIPTEFKYAYFIGGSSNAWLYSVMFAPYIKSSGADTSPSTIFARFTSLLATTLDQQYRSHIYACKLYNVVPMCYEGGPDLQNSPSLMVATQTDPGMGTALLALMNQWYQYGGKHFHLFTLGVGSYSNSDAQSGWNVCQDYNDGSPKLVAMQNFATPVTYTNAQNHVLSGNEFQLLTSNGQLNATNGMFYWYDKTVLRGLEWSEPFPVDGTYTFSVMGSDSAGAALAQFYVDGALVGSTTLPANGSGSNNASTPGAAPVFTTPTITAGAHNVAVRFAANNGNSPGIGTITIAQSP